MPVFVFMFIGVLGLAFVAQHVVNGMWSASFSALANEFGLEFIRGNWLRGPRVEGIIEGRQVVIDRFKGRGKKSPLRTRIRVETDFSAALELKQETLGASLGKAFLGSDIETGDPDFDGQVLVRGADETSVLASMTTAARDAVVFGLAAGTQFADGYASVARNGRVRIGVAQEMLDQALSAGLASRAVASSTAEQLAFNAVHDDVRGVRVRNFQKLLEWNPKAERTMACARELAQTEDPILRAMACGVLPDDVARASLIGALKDAVAAQRLVDGHAIVASQLGRRFPESPVLHQITPWLLSQLRVNAAAATNAAEALGAFADISVVEKMLEAARGGAKKAIREAVVQIQSRATGGLGQLSVVQTETSVGALSVANEAGQVSVAEVETSEIER